MKQKWLELHQWVFPQRFFRENLKLGEGGEGAPRSARTADDAAGSHDHAR